MWKRPHGAIKGRHRRRNMSLRWMCRSLLPHMCACMISPVCVCSDAFWHRIHVLMPFLSQKTEREEFPLQQVSSKGAQACVKLISYLCLDLFWRVGKDTHPYSWPWERFLSVYREKTLSFKRCLTRNGSEIFPLAFLGKDADKIWIVRPTIASGSQSWWKRGARTKRWPWGDEGEGRGRKGKWRSEMLKGRREKWKQDASMT